MDHCGNVDGDRQCEVRIEFQIRAGDARDEHRGNRKFGQRDVTERLVPGSGLNFEDHLGVLDHLADCALDSSALVQVAILLEEDI